jgi:hypothetical protein
MKFTLKRPCSNCPFIKGTSMELQPGRMEGIVEHIKSDYNVFPCHKTTKHDEDEEGESITVPHDKEQACMGALAYAYRHHGVIPVMARLAIRYGELDIKTIEVNFKNLEEPGKWPTR